ncbi:MAG: hypothetical protein V1929_00585 [bacterium]
MNAHVPERSEADTDRESNGGWARYIPLVVHAAAICLLASVPLRIISHGFLPSDDALRHVAKVLSGKSWPEILVLRPGIEIDHNAGWHQLLSVVHQATGWGADGLVSFSVTLLCVLFLLAPLAFLSRPEAWLATLLAATVAHPHLPYRIALGRPYIFVMTSVMVIFFLWMRRGDHKPTWRVGLITTLLMSVSIWLHGGWYLYWLPAAGFFLALRWRQGFVMTGCWLLGSVFAGIYTGHPVFFLEQQFQVLQSCFSYGMSPRMLVTEFKPFDGAHTFVVAAALVLIAQALRGRSPVRAAHNPAFMMAALCWVFGFLVRRFWTDWGTPVFLVWMALELQDMIDDTVPSGSLRRLILTGLTGMGFFFAAGSDYENRWTSNLTTEYLTPANKDLEGWLPEPDGIIYSDDSRIFYRTFYKNPTAPWRYVLGFEWTFMTEENIAVLQKIEWNNRTSRAYEPWVLKMRPEDRMILFRPLGAAPAIPELEWYYGATDTWIGRTPRRAHAPSATP